MPPSPASRPRQAPYDVIIVDQKMPNLSGVQLVEAIRQRRIPGEIIVLSAHLTGEMRAAYERLNVHAIFPKPFDINELRATVGHLADAPVSGLVDSGEMDLADR